MLILNEEGSALQKGGDAPCWCLGRKVRRFPNHNHLQDVLYSALFIVPFSNMILGSKGKMIWKLDMNLGRQWLSKRAVHMHSLRSTDVFWAVWFLTDCWFALGCYFCCTVNLLNSVLRTFKHLWICTIWNRICNAWGGCIYKRQKFICGDP